MEARKTPQQAVYDWTYKTASEFVDTYDHLPQQSENAPYPFVVVEETVISHQVTKSDVGGTVTQTLDVWGGADMKRLVGSLADQLIHAASHTFSAYGYRLSGEQWHHTAQTMTDASVANTVLPRVQVTLIFQLM